MALFPMSYALETVSQFKLSHILPYRHSGLDPESRVLRFLTILDAGSSPAWRSDIKCIL